MVYSCTLLILFIVFIITHFYYKRNNKNSTDSYTDSYNKTKNVKYNSLIVISFYKFTTSQMNRWMNIGKLLPKGYKLVYVTESCNYVEELKPFEVFCFTRNDFVREFPLYKTMGGNCQNQQPGFYMWSMWLESVLHSIKEFYNRYNFIWIIEGDVGYSGNINMFFKKYDNFYSDLVSLPFLAVNNTKDWCWYECYTKEYKEWIKSISPIERLIAGINVVRLSSKLIDIVMSNLKLNKHSHCESTLLETAKYNNLLINIIEKGDLGERIGVGDRVSVYDWKFFNNDPLKQNKLYHALKF